MTKSSTSNIAKIDGNNIKKEPLSSTFAHPHTTHGHYFQRTEYTYTQLSHQPIIDGHVNQKMYCQEQQKTSIQNSKSQSQNHTLIEHLRKNESWNIIQKTRQSTREEFNLTAKFRFVNPPSPFGPNRHLDPKFKSIDPPSPVGPNRVVGPKFKSVNSPSHVGSNRLVGPKFRTVDPSSPVGPSRLVGPKIKLVDPPSPIQPTCFKGTQSMSMAPTCFKARKRQAWSNDMQSASMAKTCYNARKRPTWSQHSSKARSRPAWP